MNNLQSILIRWILGADTAHLKCMFIVANTFAGGLTDRDKLDDTSAAIISRTQSTKEQERAAVLAFMDTLQEVRA